MEVELLVKSIGTLVLILGFLLYFLLSSSKKKSMKKRKSEEKKVKNTYPTFESLVALVKDKKVSTEQLSEAIDNILKYYGNIHPKLGIRTHPDFNTYGLIMLKICHHPHTNKTIILKYDRELRAKNPAYEHEINDFLTKGLDTRGM